MWLYREVHHGFKLVSRRGLLADPFALGVCLSMVEVIHSIASVLFACHASCNQVLASIFRLLSQTFSFALSGCPLECSYLTLEISRSLSWWAMCCNAPQQ